MKYRKFGKLGIECSAFGVGCMRFDMITNENGESVVDESKSTPIIRRAIEAGVNYFDTAYVYSGKKNEVAVGHALRDGYRDRVYLATKLPTWECHTREDMDRFLDEQLANLETDHIDFYLVHSLGRESWNRIKELGVLEFLDRAKVSGKIKYACFSFHDNYETFVEIIDSYDWDMCQIQYNYLDIEHQATRRGLEYAHSKNIPVVIMEGLRGGKLANVPANVREIFDSHPTRRTPVEWAFRWLLNQEGVATVLSGVNTMEQLEDNLRIFNEAEVGCMSEEEDALITSAREAYESRTKVGCTGCAYCVPCPAGVEIPRIFATWNNLFMFGEKLEGNPRYAKLIADEKSAANCLECGACEGLCPQHLSIIDLLKVAHGEMK